jgi:large subunit ribosomal protein L15
MLQLNNLTDLVKKRKRVGRGGNKGGTSGKGNKGQKARTGHSAMRAAFEGGQMPLVRRLPKRGFNNKVFQKVIEIVNIDALESAFDVGQEVTQELLIQKGLIRGKKNALLKVLGNGSLVKKLTIHAHAVSASARESIEKSGGTIHLIEEI